MKKLAAMLLVCLFCAGAASAAQWPEGLGPEKPYSGLRPQDLEKSLGYVMLYPCAAMPAERFCDTLRIYLPREDVSADAGEVLVHTADGEEYCRVDVGDGWSATVRNLTEEEAEGLMWGGGVCVEFHLPVSLRLGEEYYVTTTEGCVTAAEGALPSPAITATNAWTLSLSGEYGVGGLTWTGEEGSAPSFGTDPAEGGAISFELTLGGDAKRAVVYSENSSVFFETLEYEAKTVVTGTIVGPEPSWGVAFLDGDGQPIDRLDIDG